MIFALDVGTRTLKAVLADIDEEENIIIHHCIMREHENRAMIDGQIHDIHKVAKGVNKVVTQLKELSGEKIDTVAVALAGRFLITSTGESSMDISSIKYIQEDTIRKIELDAVKTATENLDNFSSGMYCVGYSVLYYKLNDEWIKKLDGQRGEKASVKVIAAFLPKNVVQAMMTVLEINNLTPVHITLEPIAAMNLIVPPDLRNLNIVMVDVGAGTSDIAISSDGTIIGYGMVPLAGDEITEAITKALLVDFVTAENIKRNLSVQQEFVYKDILDFDQKTSAQDIKNINAPVLDEITSKISEKILELNGKPPVAVMIVGGGGKAAGFKEKLAEKLSLIPNRVALKEASSLSTLVFENEKLNGSEFITPIGIANVALRKEGNVFNTVTVNGKTVNMMMIGNDLTVMQVLLQAGYTINQLIGKPSPAISVEVDKKLVIKKGNMGKEAPIRINGIPATLKSFIKPSDSIEIGEPQSGPELILKVRDIINPGEYYINGEKKNFIPQVFRNGQKLTADTIINDTDIISTKNPSLKELIGEFQKNVVFTLNAVPYEVPAGLAVSKNGEILSDSYLINYNDRLEIHPVNLPSIREFTCTELKKRKVLFNDQILEMPCEEIIVKNSGKPIDLQTTVSEGSNYLVEIVPRDPTLLDILAFLSIETQKIHSFEFFINGNRAESFIQPLSENSVVRFNYS